MANKDPTDVFQFKLGERLLSFYEDSLSGGAPFDASVAEGLILAWSETEEICESPIERLLFAYILFANDGYTDVLWDDGYPQHPDFGTQVEPQAQIGTYRVDFLFKQYCGDHSSMLVVECDGHDFHERTKDQAKRDKSRDRALTKQGIPVLRFTGSEIWNTPEECAEEITSVLSDRIELLMVAAGVLKKAKK